MLAALGLLACHRSPSPSLQPRTGPASVVLITIDTLRPDRLGCYGHAGNRTPAIDALADEGMLFEDAYCDVPWTTASMASVMTGKTSASHGLEVPTRRLKAEALTLAEVLRDHGYQTAAVIASYPLDPVYGLDQGFETYDHRFSMPLIAMPGEAVKHVELVAPDGSDEKDIAVEDKLRNDAYRPDEDVTTAALHWLETARDGRPFFLWVHYFGPHEKWRGDVGFVEQEPGIVASYDGDLEKTDVAVGRFLDGLRRLGLYDKAMIILHSDHGQNLGENDSVGHGHRLDEASVRIPMIVRDPALVPAGLRRVDIARNIDIFPTALAAARIDAPEHEGRSLVPTAEDPRGVSVPPAEQTALLRTRIPTLFFEPLLVPPHDTVLGPFERFGIRTTKWKFISEQVIGDCTHGPLALRDAVGGWKIVYEELLEHDTCVGIRQKHLFAAGDPDDPTYDVAGKRPDVVSTLEALVRRGSADTRGLAGEMKLTPEAEEKLKSLGYLR